MFFCSAISCYYSCIWNSNGTLKSNRIFMASRINFEDIVLSGFGTFFESKKQRCAC